MPTVSWVTPTYAMGQPLPAAKQTTRRPGDRPLGQRPPRSRTATPPKFSQNQTVTFNGGMGKILHQCPDSGSWTYTIEMELGPEPEIGRVGSETRVLLHESDIQSVVR